MANLGDLFVSLKLDPRDLKKMAEDITSVAKWVEDKTRLKLKLDEKQARSDFERFIADVKRKWSAEVKVSISRATEDLARLKKRLSEVTDRDQRVRIRLDIGKTNEEIARLKKELKSLETPEAVSAGGIRWAIGGIAGGAGIGFIFQQTRAVEEFRSSLGILIKDQAQYAEILRQTQSIAALLGQSETEIGKSVQQLIAYGISAEKIPPLLRNIQDAAAASGKGEEGFRRISLAIGQISSSGIIAKQDLNQLNEVFPASQILTEKLGLTADQVRNIGEQAIPSEVAIAALMEGISERYGGAAEARLKAIWGAMDALTGSTKTAASAIGGELSEGTAFMLNVLQKFVEFIARVFFGLFKLIKSVGSGIIGVFVWVFNGVVKVIGNAFTLISRLARALVTDFKGVGLWIAEALLDGVVAGVNAAIAKLNEFVSFLNKTFQTSLSQVALTISNPLKGAGGDNTALIKEIASLGQDSGQIFAQELSNGIGAGLDLAAEEFKGIFSGADLWTPAQWGITDEQKELLKNFKLGAGGSGKWGKSGATKDAEERLKVQKQIEESIRREHQENIKDAQRDVFKKFSDKAAGIRENIADVKKLTGEYDNLKKKYEETGKKGREEIDSVSAKIAQLQVELASIISEGQTTLADRAVEVQKEIAELQKQLLAGGSAEDQAERQKRLNDLTAELELSRQLTSEKEREEASRRAARSQTQVLLDEINARKQKKQQEIADEEEDKRKKEADLAKNLLDIQTEIDAKALAIRTETQLVSQQKAELTAIEERYTQFLIWQGAQRKQILLDLKSAAIEAANALRSSGLSEDSSQVRTGFMAGGYTGEGAAHEVAGVVHKGEYVIPKHIVSRVPDVVGSLEAIRRGSAGSVTNDHSRQVQISGPITVQSQSDLESMLDRWKWRL